MSYLMCERLQKKLLDNPYIFQAWYVIRARSCVTFHHSKQFNGFYTIAHVPLWRAIYQSVCDSESTHIFIAFEETNDIYFSILFHDNLLYDNRSIINFLQDISYRLCNFKRKKISD